MVQAAASVRDQHRATLLAADRTQFVRVTPDDGMPDNGTPDGDS
jgi:hypothetical protein